MGCCGTKLEGQEVARKVAAAARREAVQTKPAAAAQAEIKAAAEGWAAAHLITGISAGDEA